MEPSVYARMDEIEAEHWWFAARREIVSTIIRRLIPLPSDPKILEAGCGTGGNLAMLRSLGQLDAFEFDEAARKRAEDKAQASFPFGALPDQIPYADKRYDLIALLDVLEHIEADQASLASLAQRLTPNGSILLTVPAYPWLWSKHDERHHHFRRYTRRSLRETAEAAGLSVDQSFYFNTALLPVAIGLRGVKSLLGRDTPDDALPGATVNAILKSVFRSERHLIGKVPMPFGLSLCAILRAAPNAR